MHQAIIDLLERLAFKEASVVRWKEQTRFAAIILGVALLMTLLFFAFEWWSLWLCLFVLVLAAGFSVWTRRELDSSFDVKEVANKIEENHPDLQALLLTSR